MKDEPRILQIDAGPHDARGPPRDPRQGERKSNSMPPRPPKTEAAAKQEQEAIHAAVAATEAKHSTSRANQLEDEKRLLLWELEEAKRTRDEYKRQLEMHTVAPRRTSRFETQGQAVKKELELQLDALREKVCHPDGSLKNMVEVEVMNAQMAAVKVPPWHVRQIPLWRDHQHATGGAC